MADHAGHAQTNGGHNVSQDAPQQNIRGHASLGASLEDRFWSGQEAGGSSKGRQHGKALSFTYRQAMSRIAV